jgi:hypothetical protein
MRGTVSLSVRTRVRLLAGALAAGAMLAAAPAASAACGSGAGSCNQVDVNASIEQGITFLDANQNADGSWGTSDPGAETALALASYGVEDSGNFNSLSPARKTIVQNGLTFLLGTQNAQGAFAADAGGFFTTYDTGLALTALSLNTNAPQSAAIATAITNGRNFLIGQQQVPPQVSCQSTGPNGSGLGGQVFCGGWNYSTGSFGRSDESNTGFALTGLDVTGGVPASVAAANIGWQRNIQQLTSNPGGFPARNDGGGAYEPGINNGDFSSNANDTGSLLFGYGYDKVPGSDPGVQAAIKFGNDVLDTYELNKGTRTMVFHTGQDEDGSCVIGQGTCDWEFAPGEGGYHYSMFALVKGLSQYISPNLNDPSNFYSKAVDLLLGQQGSDGSWPTDPRDDPTVIASTGFAILALGKVGIPVFPITAKATSISSTEGQSFTGTVATFTVPSTTPTPADYSVSINWGDGVTSAGTVTGGAGSFTVSGTHTYAEEGSFTATVTITDINTTTNKATANTTAIVGDAALHASGAKPTRKGNSVSGTVATFTDDNPFAPVSDFTATIAWGDGKTTNGTVADPATVFHVSGNHTYSKSGTYTIKITIKDDGGSTATANTTVTIPAAKPKPKPKHKHHVVHGSAKLKGVPAACVLKAFSLQLDGKRISSVNWTLDGHAQHGKTVHKGKEYSIHISVSPGTHHLTVKVKFVHSSHTATRTFRRTVSGCPIIAPKFTG